MFIVSNQLLKLRCIKLPAMPPKKAKKASATKVGSKVKQEMVNNKGVKQEIVEESFPIKEKSKAVEETPLIFKKELLMIKKDPLMIKAEPLMINAEPLMIKAEPLMIKAEPLINNKNEALIKNELLTHKEEQLTNIEETLINKKESLTNKEVMLTNAELPIAHKEEQLTNKEDTLTTKEESLTIKEEALINKEDPLMYKEGNTNDTKHLKNEPSASQRKKMPENWFQLLENIRKMRVKEDANVDKYGCDKCVDPKSTPEDQNFQLLMALMISPQSRDPQIYAAMQTLLKYGCSLDNIHNTPEEKLKAMIKNVGTAGRKSAHIKKSCTMIKEQFGGVIPSNMTDLIKLTGVGPKIANLYLYYAHGEVSGIAVDTHVARIAQRFKWAKPSKDGAKIEKDIEDWLPREYWADINQLLVGFGQTICKAQKPLCNECLNKPICPFYKKSKKAKSDEDSELEESNDEVVIRADRGKKRSTKDCEESSDKLAQFTRGSEVKMTRLRK